MTYQELRNVLYQNHIKVKTAHDDLGHMIRTEYGIIYCFDNNWNLTLTIYE